MIKANERKTQNLFDDMQMAKLKIKYYLLAILLIAMSNIQAQDRFVKDLDNDGIRDTVYLSIEDSVIVCKLSTQNFAKIVSKPINIMKMNSGIRETEDGFEFYDDWMRTGYANRFKYNTKTQKMQLIGISDYAYGNVVNDGSGESCVNLLTGDYIDNWNFYDSESDTLIGSTTKSKMYFETINLEDFSDKAYSVYYINLQYNENHENAFFTEGNIPQMYLEHVERISLQFTSISESRFLNFKAHLTDSNYNFIPPIIASISFRETQ